MLESLDETAGGTLKASFASLHTGDPGVTGDDEVTTAGAIYARQAATWAAAASATKDMTATPEFDVPAGTTITHFGLWTASTAGSFIGGGALSDDETFGAQGTYTLTDADIDLT